jgi:ribonuclease BN (tRNA processing enzyme)
VRLTVVGSGTAAPEPDRVGSGYWVDAADTRILLDCGPGTVQRMARLGLPWQRLDHLVLSHFHTDHTAGLPVLLFALKWGVAERRSAPLVLWAPHGIRDRLRAMAAAFGDHMDDPGFPFVIREIGPGEAFEAGPVRIATTATPHTDVSLAFRLEHGGVALGYTGDTGPSDDVARLMAGSDLLIAECSLPDAMAKDTHLTPSTLAAMARTAGPARLLVTHVYPPLEALDPVARIREAGWDGATTRARDGLRVTVGDPTDDDFAGMDAPPGSV